MKLSEMRTALGLTQWEVAKLGGIAYGTVQYAEQRDNPKSKSYLKVLEVLVNYEKDNKVKVINQRENLLRLKTSAYKDNRNNIYQPTKILNSKPRKVKIVVFDIETTPLLVWGYPPSYQMNAIRVEKEQELLSFSFKHYNEKEIKHYSRLKYNEKQLVKMLWKIYDEADVLIGHNSIKFDTKMATQFFLKYDMKPPRPYKQLDTLQEFKKLSRENRFHLDTLGNRYFGEGKTDMKIKDLWYDCFIKNDKKSYKLLEKYNNQDVAITEKIFKKILPFSKNAVNLAVLTEVPEACPRCGAIGTLVPKGFISTGVNRYRKYQCEACGGFAQSRYASSFVKEKGGFVDVRPITKSI